MTASHTREALIVSASFLKEDLPYFAELLAEVVTQTKYTSKIIRYYAIAALKLMAWASS